MKLLRSLFKKKYPSHSWFKYIVSMLHLWLGLLSSVVIFLVCFTGATYGLKKPITDIANRNRTNVTIEKGVTLPLDVVTSRFVGDGGEVQSIFIPDEPNKALFINYANAAKGTAGAAYVNPYNGQDLGGPSTPLGGFFATMLSLHKTLLLGSAGKHIVGAAILVFVFLLLSGLVLWWPRNLKALRDGITVKWQYSPFRFLRDLHNSLGFNALFLLLFISITGLYVTYPWVKNGLIVALGGDSVLNANVVSADNKEVSGAFADLLKEMLEKEAEKQESHAESVLSIDSLVALSNMHLGYKSDIFVTFPTAENPRYCITQINSNNLLGIRFPDIVEVDKNGALKSLERFSEKPLHKQFIAMSLPLHTGDFFGMTGILVYVLASLIGCSLPITGFLLWWKKAR